TGPPPSINTNPDVALDVASIVPVNPGDEPRIKVPPKPSKLVMKDEPPPSESVPPLISNRPAVSVKEVAIEREPASTSVILGSSRMIELTETDVPEAIGTEYGVVPIGSNTTFDVLVGADPELQFDASLQRPPLGSPQPPGIIVRVKITAALIPRLP